MVMDCMASIRTYVDRIVRGDGRCHGMKVLLLDASTTQIVSCVYSQSEILSREVYLVSRLDDGSQNPNLYRIDENGSSRQGSLGRDTQKTSHLKAICFVRPTDINAGLLVRELAHPRFAEYHIFFSGIVPSGLLRLIAESDERELVKQVQEFYGDFLPINEDLLTLNCRNTLALSSSMGTSSWARDHAHLYDRNMRGLESILLALRKQPNVIRYQDSSALASQLARDIHDRIQSDQIFHFRRPRGSTVLLLILDRMDDPVTPLLSQWTYQAMVHELLGLNNNRVVLKGAPNISKDLEEVVLSAQQDEFFRNNRHSNFGELGEAIKKLLEDYRRTTAAHDVSNLNTIEDMQNFMDKFPDLRSQSHVVSKHVAIMGELARLVDVCSLMDVSAFEQELACADDHSTHVRELMDKLASPSVKIPDKLRLGLLYALRYEDSGNVNMLKGAMSRGGVPSDMIDLVDAILRYAGSSVRGPGLYGRKGGGGGSSSLENNFVAKVTKSILTSVQGVSNVYSQHLPLLMETINALLRGRLSLKSHPYVTTTRSSTIRGGSNNNTTSIIDNMDGKELSNQSSSSSEVIIFMAGGTTYEEATKVAEFNKSNSGQVRIILGGSTVHNSTSFLEELKVL